MGANIHNLIAAISPDLYCDSEVKSDVKKKIAAGEKYRDIAKIAKPVASERIDFDKIDLNSPLSKSGLKYPIEKHSITYDSFGEGLEQFYFWILDTLGGMYSKGVDKITDNFVSSVGSGHFSEMGAKASKMQEEGMKMLGSANQVIKSILNIIYDLKEFKIRLALYDQLKSEKKHERDGAIISLKQVWLDTVDAKRGNSSIKAMAFGNANFVTLIDAFMAVEDESLMFQGKEIDLNDRVKRILQQRIAEFRLWLRESESELRKRFEIEKIYLKSQYNTVQLYARWAKPYLKSAQQLEQNANANASLVNMFNTTLFELTLLGQSSYDPKEEAKAGELPKLFLKAKTRKYVPIIVVEFKFRSYPERGQQGYGFRGKMNAEFTSYALNDEELKTLKKEIEEDNFGDVIKMITNATDDSLSQIKNDLEEFLGEKLSIKDAKKEEKKKEVEVDPFSALFSFSFLKGWMKNDGGIEEDSDVESVVRSQAVLTARKGCLNFYEIFKKAHGMPSLSTLD